eukprot:TRINITY_DN18713_c0_g1_i1.p2 TRINITY_DN18713_c0_g1~~TRINITY_DN18713_c0_g1_i1.p2  ORF type:complete len:137 (-),score=43.04 TRINITY_DN18713_c0_g1_i1:55-465(-)
MEPQDAVPLSDSDCEDEMETELAAMRAEIVENERTIEDLQLRMRESADKDRELQRLRGLLGEAHEESAESEVDITVMLEQIALDEALLAELSLRAGEPGQEDELQSELTGLKDEKWRLEQCLQLSLIHISEPTRPY